MDKLFLIVFGVELDRTKLVAYLEGEKAISFWFYNMPYSFFAKSKLNSSELRKLINNHFGNEKVFIIELKKGIDFSAMLPQEHIPLFSDVGFPEK